MKFNVLFIICFFALFGNRMCAQEKSYSIIDTTGMAAYFAAYTIDLKKVENIDLYISIYKWKETPYLLGGNSEHGIDCSNLVNQIYEEVYNTNLKGNVLGLYPKCESLELKDMAAEGDLLFFKINKPDLSHVGIYLQHGMFVHATLSSGVMINNLEQPYYERYFYQAARPSAEYLFSEN